jgi:hypothetical protein
MTKTSARSQRETRLQPHENQASGLVPLKDILWIFAARFCLVALIGNIVPEGTVYADATFIAMLYILYAAADSAAAFMMIGKSPWLCWSFCVSSAWCALISIEQLMLNDVLLSLDDYASPLMEAIIVTALIKELLAWLRLKRLSCCSP